MSETSSGVTLLNTLPSTTTTGASPQAPTHLKHSIVNLRSLVVSPALIPNCFSNSARTALDPLTKQAVPKHTLILCSPTGVVEK